jgi:hypothetical protein
VSADALFLLVVIGIVVVVFVALVWQGREP